jgi:predicted RNase H-like nuclease (RuvC/YqgF family)
MRTLLEQITELKAELVTKQTAIDELTQLVQTAKNTPTVPVADTDEFKALVQANATMSETIEQLTIKLGEAETKVKDFDAAVKTASSKLALEIAAQQGLPTPVKDVPEDNSKQSKVFDGRYTLKHI